VQLRDHVRGLASRLATRRVLVTSIGANGSKAAVVASLARSLAIGRTRTLVIDADLAEPSGVARACGMSGDRGLSELLLGTASFAEIASRDTISGAEVLAAGSSGAAAAGLLDSDRMDLILSALDQAYDMVIVNGPPATGDNAGKAVARRVSLALLVTGADQNGVDAANLAAHVLIAEGVREVLPVLVNGDGPRSEIRFGNSASGFGRAA
jgi:Mrp family chromosome partitioning ATPase